MLHFKRGGSTVGTAQQHLASACLKYPQILNEITSNIFWRVRPIHVIELDTAILSPLTNKTLFIDLDKTTDMCNRLRLMSLTQVLQLYFHSWRQRRRQQQQQRRRHHYHHHHHKISRTDFTAKLYKNNWFHVPANLSLDPKANC